MKDLKENATVQEQCDFFKEQSVDFATQYLQLIDKYNYDIKMLMFIVAEYVENFEDLLYSVDLGHVVAQFKKDMTVKNLIEDNNLL